MKKITSQYQANRKIEKQNYFKEQEAGGSGQEVLPINAAQFHGYFWASLGVKITVDQKKMISYDGKVQT